MIEITSERTPYRQDRAPWGPREILIVFGITIVALVGVFTVLSFVVRGLDIEGDVQDDPVALTVLLVGQIVLDVIAVAVAAGFSLAKYGLPAAAWSLVRPPRINIGLIFATLVACYAALIGYAAIVTVLGLDALRPESNVPTGLFEFRAVIPLAVFLVVIVAPVAEEMFFRGFVFHGLWSRIGFWPAALGSGFLFSIIHVMSLDMIGLIIPFMLIGTLFAWLVRRTGSLWNAIIVHFLFNSISLSANFAQRLME